MERMRCPECHRLSIIRLPDDWQDRVDHGEAIQMVGCGNPWHYANVEQQNDRKEWDAATHTERARILAAVKELPNPIATPKGRFVWSSLVSRADVIDAIEETK